MINIFERKPSDPKSDYTFAAKYILDTQITVCQPDLNSDQSDIITGFINEAYKLRLRHDLMFGALCDESTKYPMGDYSVIEFLDIHADRHPTKEIFTYDIIFRFLNHVSDIGISRMIKMIREDMISARPRYQYDRNSCLNYPSTFDLWVEENADGKDKTVLMCNLYKYNPANHFTVCGGQFQG